MVNTDDCANLASEGQIKAWNDYFLEHGDHYYTQSEEPILQAILKERRRQDRKWGAQNHSPVEWLAILGEEYGESCKAALGPHFSDFREDDQFSEYETEMVQVAAVALAAIENLHRQRKAAK